MNYIDTHELTSSLSLQNVQNYYLEFYDSMFLLKRNKTEINKTIMDNLLCFPVGSIPGDLEY